METVGKAVNQEIDKGAVWMMSECRVEGVDLNVCFEKLGLS